MFGVIPGSTHSFPLQALRSIQMVTKQYATLWLHVHYTPWFSLNLYPQLLASSSSFVVGILKSVIELNWIDCSLQFLHFIVYLFILFFWSLTLGTVCCKRFCQGVELCIYFYFYLTHVSTHALTQHQIKLFNFVTIYLSQILATFKEPL